MEINNERDPKKIFGKHYYRLLEQDINVRDRLLQNAYQKAKKKYTENELELTISCFELRMSRDGVESPNSYLNSALTRGFWI